MSIQTLSELFLEISGYDKPNCMQQKVGGRFQPISTQKIKRRVVHQKFGYLIEEMYTLAEETHPTNR